MTRSRTQLCATLTLLATSLVGQSATSQPRPKLELEEIGNWRMAGGTTFSMAFDPTGCILASGGEQGEILLWDWKKRKILRRYKKEQNWIGILRFSPDGKQLALMASGLRVLDPDSGRDLFSHTGGGLHGLAYDTKGKRLAYAAGNGTVTVLDTQTWKPLRSFQAHSRLPVRSLCFGPKDAVVFAGTDRGHIWRLDLASGEEIREETLASTPQGLALLPDGRWILTTSGGGTEFIPQDQLLERIDAKTGKVQAETWSKVWWLRYIGSDLVLAHDGQQLSLWDPRKLERIQVLYKGAISLARLSPDKKRLALTHGATLNVFRILR